MTLGELIAWLEAVPPETVCRIGFTHAHSYRGDYSCLAFVPMNCPCPVSAILSTAKRAVGQTFDGYKGGRFLMGLETSVFLANYGRTGEEIGPLLLSLATGIPWHG